MLDPVSDYWANASRRTMSIAVGLFFGVFFTGFNLVVGDSSVASALASGVISGLIFGAVMGTIVFESRARAQASMGPLPADQRRQAERSAVRGPVPADPIVRRAAWRLAQFRLEQSLASRWYTAALCGFGLVAGLIAGVLSSPGWAVLGLIFGGLLVATLLGPERTRRRIDLLGADLPPESPSELSNLPSDSPTD